MAKAPVMRGSSSRTENMDKEFSFSDELTNITKANSKMTSWMGLARLPMPMETST